jgi:hypothetical protein
MSYCVFCGMSLLVGQGDICPHHELGVNTPDNWADANRRICNFIHRRVLEPDTRDPKARESDMQTLLWGDV